MSYDKVVTIKNEIEKFKDAKFYSLVGEDTVIIRNAKTNALYEVPYEETENGYLFKGEQALMVEEKHPSQLDEFKQNSETLKKAINVIFTEEVDYDVAIHILDQVIQDLPAVDPALFATAEKEEVAETYEGILAEKVNEYKKAEKEYNGSNIIFDEEDNMIEKTFGSSAVIEIEKELDAEIAEYKESIEAFKELKKALSEKLQKPELEKYILENLMEKENVKMAIPKVLVQAKQVIAEEFNAVDATRSIISVFEDLTPALKMDKIYNYAQNNRERPTFLKFKMGVFTVEDAMTLYEELDQVLTKLGELDDEEMMYVANQKAIVEYMMRTRKISDRVMMEVIESFNKKFNNKEAEDAYTQSEFGWKDRDEAKMGNMTGKASRDGEAE
jgi:tetratricopeptide (TPR) repeat protein